MATPINPDVIAYEIIDLPQPFDRTAYGVSLVYADGSTGQIGIASRSRRGVRQQMSSHRAFKHLSERIVTPDQALIATVNAVARTERV
jgi:hypothetical protein